MITLLLAILSPTIAHLEMEVDAGNTEALTEFYQAIDGPIVEEDGLVTFVYRGHESGVKLQGCFLELQQAVELTRLGDTDLCYCTVELPKDLRLQYWFSTEQQPVMVDRFNELTFPWGDNTPRSLLELPDAPAQPWIVKQDHPEGMVDEHTVKSLRLMNERTVKVYTPPGYSEDCKPYPLVVIFDGWAFTELVPTPTILDNLIAEGEIPPVVALFVGNTNRKHELPCNHTFAYFVADELVPWAQETYHITRDPAQTVIGGASYGGLAAAYIALKFPEVFGNVLSQSGSFWYDSEWLIREYEISPKHPINFYLDIGTLEERGPNQKLRDTLQNQGYSVTYAEFPGGHDYICWRGTLSDGLITLLKP